MEVDIALQYIQDINVYKPTITNNDGNTRQANNFNMIMALIALADAFLYLGNLRKLPKDTLAFAALPGYLHCCPEQLC